MKWILPFDCLKPKHVRNDLEDNRGTKIKREIPQLLIFNELRDLTVPRTGTLILNRNESPSILIDFEFNL